MMPTEPENIINKTSGVENLIETCCLNNVVSNIFFLTQYTYNFI